MTLAVYVVMASVAANICSCGVQRVTLPGDNSMFPPQRAVLDACLTSGWHHVLLASFLHQVSFLALSLAGNAGMNAARAARWLARATTTWMVDDAGHPEDETAPSPLATALPDPDLCAVWEPVSPSHCAMCGCLSSASAIGRAAPQTIDARGTAQTLTVALVYCLLPASHLLLTLAWQHSMRRLIVLCGHSLQRLLGQCHVSWMLRQPPAVGNGTRAQRAPIMFSRWLLFEHSRPRTKSLSQTCRPSSVTRSTLGRSHLMAVPLVVPTQLEVVRYSGQRTPVDLVAGARLQLHAWPSQVRAVHLLLRLGEPTLPSGFC